MSRRVAIGLAFSFCLVLFVFAPISFACAEDNIATSTDDATKSVWFSKERSANLAATVIFGSLVLFFVFRGKNGKSFYIRPVAGLSAVEEAVGRAAEMGRPVSFVPGLTDISDPATVASMSVLAKVAYRAAVLRCRVLVPNYSALTFPVAETVVQDAFARAGRTESFIADDIMFFTSRHMTYTMAVVGTMTREKPAANFLVGHFFSESLILAETGAGLGAVQIGACDSVSQLPFFITACDHTLIGEELFAAGALLSDDPSAKASIAAHDCFKIAAAALMLFALLLKGLDAAGIHEAGTLAMQLASLLREGK